MKRALVLVLVAACDGGGNTTTTDGSPGGDGATSDGTMSDAAACPPGQVDVGTGCVAIDPGDPAQRTQAEVCMRWKADHVLTAPQPFSRATTNDCDAGTLSAGGHADTLKRINLFRWLSGLGPTTVNTGLDTQQQQCANMESWWDFSLPASPHSPPTTAKCYTAAAAAGAGSSNLAWGMGLPRRSISSCRTMATRRRWATAAGS